MERKISFIATGDAFMTRLLGEKAYPGFDKIRDIILSHDVRFSNIEFTAHNQEGFPDAFSGGTWAMSDPAVLDDLKRFGFNIYNTANNHSMDWGHGGLLATIKHMKERGMTGAGTGATMAQASAPAWLETGGSRVALISFTSTMYPSDIAGNQSAEVVGRPGVNALRFSRVYNVEKKYYDVLSEIADVTDMNFKTLSYIRAGYAQPLPEGRLPFDGLSFRLADKTAVHTIPDAKDVARAEKAVKEAKRQGDIVLVSVHSHEFDGQNVAKPSEFFVDFAHKCIDAGADAIIGHGPHELRGIEIYKSRPVFYSLGNFIFQTETVSCQPAEAYENAGVPADTTVGEYMDMRSANGTRGYVVMPEIWRSVMASFTAEDGVIREIKLYPITLNMDNMDEPRSRRGWPALSDDNSVLKHLAELSSEFGTEIDISDNIGVIHL